MSMPPRQIHQILCKIQKGTHFFLHFQRSFSPLLNNLNMINSVLKVWCSQLELLLAHIERQVQAMRHIRNQCVRCGVNTLRMRAFERTGQEGGAQSQRCIQTDLRQFNQSTTGGFGLWVWAVYCAWMFWVDSWWSMFKEPNLKWQLWVPGNEM